MIKYFLISLFILMMMTTYVSGQDEQVTNPITILSVEDMSEEKIKLQLDAVLEGLNLVYDLSRIEKSVQLSTVEGFALAFRLLLDNIIVHSGQYTEKTKATTYTIPYDFSHFHGKHILSIEVDTPDGHKLSKSISFELDTSPKIEANIAGIRDGFLDPELTVSFPVVVDDIIGRIEIFIDKQHYSTIEVTKENNNLTKLLSDMAGEPLCTSNLASGEHLLEVRGISQGGGETIIYEKFQIYNLPRLSTTSLEDNLQSLEASFSHCGEGYAGRLDIFYKQGIILSKESLDSTIKINRNEITKAFIKHNLKDMDTADLVIVLRAANGVETWRHIKF
jgi:hypothetical protein